jgi:hypothetical protein
MMNGITDCSAAEKREKEREAHRRKKLCGANGMR